MSTPSNRPARFRTTLLAWLIAGLLTPFALAAPPEHAAAATSEFVAAAKALRHAHDRPAAVEALVAMAHARRDLLQETIAANPAEVLRSAIPERLHRGLPAEVQSLLETRIDAEAILEVVYEHRAEQTALRHFAVIDGERVALHFAGAAPDAHSGQRQRISGVRIGNVVAVDPDVSGPVTMNLDNTGGLAEASAGSLSNTTGERRVAVLLVNFADQPTAQPYSVTEAHDLVVRQPERLSFRVVVWPDLVERGRARLVHAGLRATDGQQQLPHERRCGRCPGGRGKRRRRPRRIRPSHLCLSADAMLPDRRWYRRRQPERGLDQRRMVQVENRRPRVRPQPGSLSLGRTGMRHPRR